MLEDISGIFEQPIRHIECVVTIDKEEINGYSTDTIKSLTVERMGEGKFFGYGVSQKINLKLIKSDFSLSTENSLNVYFNDISNTPPFYITEVHKDENTGELSITAYDALYKANEHTVAEIELGAYTLRELAAQCALLLGLSDADIRSSDIAELDLEYPGGANLEGTEGIRDVLNAIAEVTQSIYYIGAIDEFGIGQNKLVFKQLKTDDEAAYSISKDMYFTLDSKTNRRLAAIASVTELADNVEAKTTLSGTKVYIRENPFYVLRDDVGALLDTAIAKVGNLSIAQFTCSWRGNFNLEIGDKIAIEDKDGNYIYAYFVNDAINFDGTFSQETSWEYVNDEETESNPSTLGEVLAQTFARVDKANKEISLVASEAEANKQAIAAIQVNIDSISASVERTEEATAEEIESLNTELATLTERVNAQITPEDLTIEIQKELAAGTTKVTTATGFTFNEEGLTVAKTNSEISTTITEDGMTITKGSDEVLQANNEGVAAVDLHARTFLIIGNNSRFEDFGERTACFWIGG